MLGNNSGSINGVKGIEIPTYSLSNLVDCSPVKDSVKKTTAGGKFQRFEAHLANIASSIQEAQDNFFS